MHHNYRLCASSRAKAAEAAAPSSDHPDPSRARAQIVCRRDAAALARSAPTARRREHGLPGGEPLSAIPPTPAQVSAAQLRRSANRRVVPARCTPATFGGGRSCHGPRSNAKNGLTGTLQGAIWGAGPQFCRLGLDHVARGRCWRSIAGRLRAIPTPRGRLADQRPVHCPYRDPCHCMYMDSYGIRNLVRSHFRPARFLLRLGPSA